MFTAPATCHLLFVYKRNKNLQSENTCWFSRPVLDPGVLLTKQSCPQTTPWLGCRKHPLAVSIPLFLFCWVRIPQKVNPDERIWNWKAKLECNTKKRKKRGGGFHCPQQPCVGCAGHCRRGTQLKSLHGLMVAPDNWLTHSFSPHLRRVLSA